MRRWSGKSAWPGGFDLEFDVAREGVIGLSSVVITAEPMVRVTSEGPYAIAARPSSGVPIHMWLTNFGNPWLKLAGAALVVRREAVDVGVGAVCPVALLDRALDLVRLLVVLVRPHVGGEGSREVVVGEGFETVGVSGSAEEAR